MAIVTRFTHTNLGRIRESLTSRQACVLQNLKGSFIIKLTALSSNEAAIFLVSPIKKQSVIELLAYIEILNDDLYPHVVMSIADYAFILRRYYGFKDIPHRYLKHIALPRNFCEVNLYGIWNYYVPDLAGPADVRRLNMRYGSCGVECVLKALIHRFCKDHPWAFV